MTGASEGGHLDVGRLRDRLVTGQTFGDYRILAPLGSGGMGVVYAAEDTRLHRKVAIKFLAADAVGDDERRRQRLLHEARAAAALDHPNICTIYDVGEAQGRTFIVMQLVEGDTLAATLARGPLATAQAFSIASQVADALAHAHDRGIVHRDIKPPNVMLSARGQAKVLDFGVARSTQPVDANAATLSGMMTLEHGIAGTVPYMSPEQVRNEPLDGRSDIFSLGTMLYEMMTGRHPFAGRSNADTIAAVLTQPLPPLDQTGSTFPTDAERIVQKCLDKDPDRRYQSARELVVDLRRALPELDATASTRSSSTAVVPQPSFGSSGGWSGRRYAAVALVIAAIGLASIGAYRWWPVSGAIDSIAVLPLVNASGDPELDYQTEGTTDAIIETLSRLPDLKVMSRNAVFRYKGREMDAQSVGRDLGVEAVLTGRVVGRGDALTLRLELVHASDNRHLWGEQYELTPSNLLTVQRDVPAAIAEQLRLRLNPATVSTTNHHTDDPEAYRMLLLGRFAWRKFTRDGMREAFDYYQKAIDRDPDYALAYAGLAEAYIGGATGLPKQEARQRARAAAMKALALDPGLGEPHSSLAYLLAYEDWDFAGAERELARAVALSPGNADVHHNYAHFLLIIGRTDAALAEGLKVQELDPLSSLAADHLGYHAFYTRQFKQAISHFETVALLGPMPPGDHQMLGEAYREIGQLPRAFEEYVKGHTRNGATAAELTAINEAIRTRGMEGYLRTRIAQLEARGEPEPNISPMTSLGGQLAWLHARLGDKDGAFRWLERLYTERDPALVHLREEIGFDPLRSDPRFADLLRRIGLPPV